MQFSTAVRHLETRESRDVSHSLVALVVVPVVVCARGHTSLPLSKLHLQLYPYTVTVKRLSFSPRRPSSFSIPGCGSIRVELYSILDTSKVNGIRSTTAAVCMARSGHGLAHASGDSR